ncbi:MAG: hypothetical protein HKN11_15885 [Rhizobiales bacterium]|nr:hypothetical protein [Hyphomicrobiales bacterium]
MKLPVVATLAAVLVAGIAGSNHATDASAAIPKLKLKGLCATVNGGTISKPGFSSFSGWKSGICVRHVISSTRAVRAEGAANFNAFNGLSATPTNIARCVNSFVVLHFYRHQGGWKRVASKKVNAVPKVGSGEIIKCSAKAGIGYAQASTGMYQTVVMAVDGDNNSQNVTRASLMRTQSNLL